MKSLLTSLKGLIRKQEPESHRLGRWGENQAAKFLKKHGYTILDRRIGLGPKDEIDLVVKQDRNLIFVEVKTRSKKGRMRPASAVGKDKQKAQVRAAANYLKAMKTRPGTVRFDIIEVIGTPKTKPEITHIENAFNASPHRTFQW